ncbi:hypothetical protein HOP52_12200 [Halomonas campisalis]|uniref:Uncharacterized protein n=1 Tax=Billgrantia campisalis TaxID=74661 RepID=A0ABS9PBK7_9GAMM|nr:hypothetical protein [Halomonas campisalis]MCG6658515.1 hypothetical protein [Halomonas campisalis]MDR5863376.1 hypothetical protein [Halomonas campisalis]
MNISFAAPCRPHWQHIHADWWQDDQGNDIHRVEVDDETLYHCHLAGSPLPWDAVTNSLDGAMAACSKKPSLNHRPAPTGQELNDEDRHCQG